jgi:hypothetical protein
VDSFRAYERSFTSLADAQAFFTYNLIDIGFQRGGLADVELVFDLTAQSQVAFSSLCLWDNGGCARAHRWRWSTRPDLGERRSAGLVATASEVRLNIPAESGVFRPMNEFVDRGLG